MDGSSMHVQENSQHQCRLHCAMHYCGYAKRPHRLVPRACPGQPEAALRGDLGARSPENNDFAVHAPEFSATFRAQPASVPGTLRPLRAKTHKTQRLRRWEAKASKEIVWHRNSTPTRTGLQFRHFLDRRCRKTSHAHNGAQRLCAEKTRPVAQRKRKSPQKVQGGCCVVNFVAHGFPFYMARSFLQCFIAISVPRLSFHNFFATARATVCACQI